MNRLIKEKSPYLLQHANNPVEWHAWNDEAFAKSRNENKPILLSIGYSTCHWCHVMEHESFEDAVTAELMNRDFISIKVDREERPDIDQLYMNYVMATTGSGGWPMTVFLTPDKKPFYGGTYFPPEDRYGMPGFKTLLLELAHAWKNRRDEIIRSADSATAFLNAKNENQKSEVSLSAKILEAAFERHRASFDAEWGGFGGAPKFPRTHTLSMLLRHWRRSQNPDALILVEKTLQAMARGGIYDQIGGGFHRYSTDNQWRVPHFEKMLYDQALLTGVYLEAFEATLRPEYAKIAEETLAYVTREMTDVQGGFFSAQDADSEDPYHLGEKREGAFFVWAQKEIEALFPAEEASVLLFFYGIRPEGNALSDPHKEFGGYNVLHQSHTLQETAAHFKKTEAQIEAVLAKARGLLLEKRGEKPRPHLDDKVLTDWNGLMIAAFARAASVLGEPRYAKTATAAANFILKRLQDSKGVLLHRYRDGESGIRASLNDYAFLIYGLLHLYQATFEPAWLEESKRLAQEMMERFWDRSSGGFFLAGADAQDLIARSKEVYDGAIPSGNSMAATVLVLLSRYAPDASFGEMADKTLQFFSGDIAAEPTAYPQMLVALDFQIGPSYEITIAGSREESFVKAALQEIYLRFIPNKIIMLDETGQRLVEGKAALYICRGRACERPVTKIEDLGKVLNNTLVNP